jgi:large subunit ribosomal protein L30
MSAKTLRITQTKSSNGRLASHKACLKGLGLRRIGDVVVREDSPEVRGMVARISYMVSMEQN